MNTLSPQAQEIVEKYLSLPLGNGCSTPYFNNRRKKIRAGLRALIGKGRPEEISEEAEMFSIRERIGIKKMQSNDLKKFLTEHDLGIDCSGLAYHVLDAEIRARGKGKMSTVVKPFSGFVRKLKHTFRPAENTGVSTFSHSQNSNSISETDITAGDFISIISSNNTRNHMIVVEKTETTNDNTVVTYIHSIAYPEDGLYNTGVRRGTIMFRKKQPILEAVWSEKLLFDAVKSAQDVSVRRLRAFVS